MTSLHGTKTVEANLRFMKDKLLLFLTLGSSLFGAPQYSDDRVGELDYKLRSQQSELELLNEKIDSLSEKIQKIPPPSTGNSAYEMRIANLEQTQRAILTDLKTLQGDLHKNQNKIADIDKKLGTELAELKNSLKTILAFLKNDSEEFYTVKVGDSLGQIAIEHKTSIKEIKNLNNLASDNIFVGQKLRLK